MRSSRLRQSGPPPSVASASSDRRRHLRRRRSVRSVLGCHVGREHLALRADVPISGPDSQTAEVNRLSGGRCCPAQRRWPSFTRLLTGMGSALLAVVVTTMLVSAPPASGGTVRAKGTSCANFEGPFPAGPFSLSGCSDVANTGGSGSLDNRTGVITWASRKTTTVSYALTPIEDRANHPCPPTAAAEFKLRGTVVADSSGSIEVGGPVTGRVCARENGLLTIAQGTMLKIL